LMRQSLMVLSQYERSWHTHWKQSTLSAWDSITLCTMSRLCASMVIMFLQVWVCVWVSVCIIKGVEYVQFKAPMALEGKVCVDALPLCACVCVLACVRTCFWV